MTVVAALVAPDGSVVMAADSRTVAAGGTYHWPTPYRKVGRVSVKVLSERSRQDVLVATAGSVALAQAVRHRLEWPDMPGEPQSLRTGQTTRTGGGWRAMTVDEAADAAAGYEERLDSWALEVAERVGHLALDRGMCGDDAAGGDPSRVPQIDGGLLAWDGRLWAFGPWQAFRCARGYETIGSGADVATGALWVQLEQGRQADPADVARLAVEAACVHDYGCAPPVDVQVLPPQASRRTLLTTAETPRRAR